MKKFLLFAAACVALVACNNKENALNEEPTAPGRQVTISATVEVPSGANAPIRMVSPDASSLSASTISFHWEAGDKVVLTDFSLTEKQLFTIVDNSINGNKANFTGTALSDMSSYLVFYLGKNTSIEKFISIMSSEVDNLTYEANNFHPYLTSNTPGNASGFTLDFFHYNIKVPLKGNATVGKIEYYIKNNTPKLTTTMSFGDGLALTDTEVPVYMPLFDASSNGFILKIYDTANQLLLEKTVTSSVLTDNNSKLVPFEALEVKKATPSPKDVFKDGSTFTVKLESKDYANIISFKYNGNTSTFACTYVYNSAYTVDLTDLYGPYCICTKGTGNTFTFDFAGEGYLDYNADVTPATAVMRAGTNPESVFMDFNLTQFKVNDVDIIDQITVSKQQ